ncbi:neurofilament heavy polypeptide-like [Homarus americanus]|uniref:neurofilament heavy polypeptide-like n=1 Tax=Homarus americanus TaxID=6706 RepID=UPI001C46661F|nr:neurofilament heavy polypeptide-like [Homarus americanus]
MKRGTEALKKASESDVPRFTSGSFIIGTPKRSRNHQSQRKRSHQLQQNQSHQPQQNQSHQPKQNQNHQPMQNRSHQPKEPQSPVRRTGVTEIEAEPGHKPQRNQSHQTQSEPESPAAAEPDSPAEAEPKSPAAAELESPTTVEPESPAVAKQQSSQNQITRSVKIPKKFHGTFIGHKGAHIKQIGQKYGVLLKLNTYKNNISITTTAEPESPAAAEPGSPATAERESPAVAKQQSSQNQITKSVKIPKKFHGAFIGHKGAHIKQIGQKYGVLLGLNTNKNHPKPGLCDHVPLLGDILLARKIKIEMKRVTEALKKASESDVPRFTSGSFIIGTRVEEAKRYIEDLILQWSLAYSLATAEPESPAAAEPGSPATAERESPAVAKQQSSQNQITKSVKIPKKFHGAFIGHKGAHIKQIGQKYGVLLGLNTNKNHPKPGLCDHVPLLGDILLARKIKIEMKRVTEAPKKASESDVPRFTSGSFIIGTVLTEPPAGGAAVISRSELTPAEAEPESPAAAEPESPNAAEPESPAAAEPDSPAEAEPKSPAAAELESPTTVEPESPAPQRNRSHQPQRNLGHQPQRNGNHQPSRNSSPAKIKLRRALKYPKNFTEHS